MGLNHCFEVIGFLKSLFYYIATIKFPPGLCDEQVTLQSHVETAQCRHKPISKFTCNSYEGNLSCLTNSGLLRSRPSDAIKKSYLKVPNYPKLCIPVELVVLFPKLNNSLRSSDKRLSQSTRVLPFTFPLPTSFGSLQLPADLYIFLRLF